MRRFFLLLSLVFLSTACGVTGSGSASVSCAQRFWNGAVSACLPDHWRVLSDESMRAMNLTEETIAAFQYETPHAGQIDTVVVTREPLPAPTDTHTYSEANILAVSALPEYSLIDKEVVTVDGAETALHIFSARLSANQPVRRYYQLSVASDRTGYTFTGSFPLSVQDSEASEVEFILRNVSLKDPSAASS